MKPRPGLRTVIIAVAVLEGIAVTAVIYLMLGK